MKRTTADEHLSNMFQDEDLPTTAGTLVEETFLNAVQEELANVIESDGTSLSGTAYDSAKEYSKHVQLLQAIVGMVHGMAVNQTWSEFTNTDGSDDTLRHIACTQRGYGLAQAWVAVGDEGNVRYSATGDSGDWAKQTSGTTENLFGVAVSSGGVWIAVGNGGDIIRSTNGTAWSTPTSGTLANLTDVVWDESNSQFVAIGASATVLTSPDGTTWTPRTIASDVLYAIAAKSDGRLMILGSNTGGGGTGDLCFTSTDAGVTWNLVHTGSELSANSVSWDHVSDRWLASRGFKLYTSDNDGVTWTLRYDETPVLHVAIDHAGFMMAVGNTIVVTSHNGTSWVTREPADGSANFRAVAAGFGRWCLCEADDVQISARNEG